MAALSFPTTRASGLARDLRLPGATPCPVFATRRSFIRWRRDLTQPDLDRNLRRRVRIARRSARHIFAAIDEQIRRVSPCSSRRLPRHPPPARDCGLHPARQPLEDRGRPGQEAPGSMQQYSQALPDGVNSVTGTLCGAVITAGEGVEPLFLSLRHSAPASRSRSANCLRRMSSAIDALIASIPQL